MRFADAEVRTRVWRKGVLEAENFPLAQVSNYLDMDDRVVWVDLSCPEQAELQKVADELGLDPLAVEDAVGRHERPKVDRYPNNTFLTAYAVSLEDTDDGGRLRLAKVAAFMLPRALVTVRYDDWFGVEEFVRRWDDNPDLLYVGVPTLLYWLLDVLVDGHFETVQRLDDEIEALEDLLFDDAARAGEVQRRTYDLRKSLVQLRRVVLPMREVVNTLIRKEGHVPSDELAEQYRDLYDHVLRATEWTESLRDLVTTVFETNLSLAESRLNNVVRKISAWAAIIAVPTAVTGFYGQNVPYPGFGQRWGFLVSSLVTLILAGGFYLGFHRKGWI